VIVGRTVYITPFPCEFLDTAKNLCSVYDRRHELNPLCLDVASALKLHALPADCGYVPVYAPPGYRPAREDYDWSREWDELDELAEDLNVSPELLAKVRARGKHAPPMYAEVNAWRAALADAPGPLHGGPGLEPFRFVNMNAPEREAPAVVPSLVQLVAGSAAAAGPVEEPVPHQRTLDKEQRV
jgi:hypothetical protein